MDDKQPGKPRSGGTLKLVAIILAVLLVPIVLDQVEIDREQLKLVGRIAVGVAVLMFAYGMFAKMLKVAGFILLALIGVVLLVCEGQIKAPRLKEFLSNREQKQGK